MFYKIEENEYGDVKDSAGKRYLLIEANMARSAQGVNVGYTEYPNRQAALDAFGVEDIPESELFTEEV